MELEKICPDTSVIIEELISKKIENKELIVKEIIIHEAVLAELEAQANEGKAWGFTGLEEIKKLQELAKKKFFEIKFGGRRPTLAEIKAAYSGAIDALIRQLAWEEDATLLTSDRVQAKTGEARGIKVVYIKKEVHTHPLLLETFFDSDVMSVHLRENCKPMAKRGKPGAWTYEAIKEKILSAEEIKDISRQIIEEARTRLDSFVEIAREGSTLVQLGPYRIVILRPPFSDGWEITAVKPIKKLKLEDYRMSEKLRKRIAEVAEGILIAGSPGHGKTTFAQALAEYYASHGKVVKTVEAPRDLVLPEEITQLSLRQGTPEEIHDILLLSRPDYTIFDEMRNTKDFLLYTDLRLAGVGMVGVLHATNSLDAIQRFIGRIELGMIPHVIDTVIFIKNGEIARVLSLKMVVKVPSGMTEADLARPVVIVNDFETEKPMAEIYTYGEQTVIVPVQEIKPLLGGAKAIAAKAIEKAFLKYTPYLKVEIPSDEKAIVYAPEKYIPAIIGREGRNISKLESELGIAIEVRELHELIKPKPEGKEVKYELVRKGRNLEIYFDTSLIGKDVDIYVDNNFLASFAIGKKAKIKIKKESTIGKAILAAEEIKIYLVE